MAYQTKEDLQKVAAEYGVDLDLTRRHADLVAEVDALKAKSESAESEPESEPEPAKVRFMFRNRLSGQVIPYDKIFEGNADLEPIEVPIEG